MHWQLRPIIPARGRDAVQSLAYLNMPGNRACQRGALRARIKLEAPPLACAVAALPDVGADGFVAAVVAVTPAMEASGLACDAALALSSYCVQTGLPMSAGAFAQAALQAPSTGITRTNIRTKVRIGSPCDGAVASCDWTRQAASRLQ